MPLATSIARFAATVAEARREVWPATIKFSDNTTADVGKTPTKLSRVPNEQGSGWTQRAIASFTLDAAGAYVPDIGAEFQITAHASAPQEVGTNWRCFDVTRAAMGAEHKCTCFRLD